MRLRHDASIIRHVTDAGFGRVAVLLGGTSSDVRSR